MSEKKQDSVDQIRDILFGEQVKLFEKKMLQIEKQISKHVSSLEDKLNQLNQVVEGNRKALQDQQSKSTQQIVKDHSATIDQLQTELSNRITETEAAVLTELDKQVSTLDSKATHRHELASLLKKMSDQLQD